MGVTIGEGASVGAGALCIAPVRIGAWALVGAGSVVTADVPDFGLMIGSPARRVGWVGRAGYRLDLEEGGGVWKCPITRETYLEVEGALTLTGSAT